MIEYTRLSTPCRISCQAEVRCYSVFISDRCGLPHASARLSASFTDVPVTFPALRKDVQKLAGVDIAFKHIRQLVTVGHPGIQLQPLSLFGQCGQYLATDSICVAARPIEPWNEDTVIYGY